jgi:hypothetical protein
MSDLERTKKDTTAVSSFNPLSSKVIFDTSVLLNFVCKKADRLATGIFLVTESFQKDDLLRSSLRMRSLDFLHKLFTFKHEGADAPLSLIGEIIALLSIASATGSVSGENKNMLELEYQKLASLIAERRFEFTQGGLPDKSFFEPVEPIHDDYARGDVHKGQRYQKGHISNNIGQIDPLSGRERGSFQGHTYGRSPRQQKILSIVDDKMSVSIRDVALSIKDCSEKTLQRDLLSLVEQGVLKKEGERRWSTYRRV